MLLMIDSTNSRVTCRRFTRGVQPADKTQWKFEIVDARIDTHGRYDGRENLSMVVEGSELAQSQVGNMV